MRVIIAGCRDFPQFDMFGVQDVFDKRFYDVVCEAVKESNFHITTVVSGRARGVDNHGEFWAKNNHKKIDPHPAIWVVNGKKDMYAGKKRNEIMAQNADALIAIWDGVSGGTKHMIERAEAHKLKVYIKWYKIESSQ